MTPAELIDRSIARHGGDRWRRLQRITFRPRSLHGALPWLKGLGRTFPLPPRIDIEPHEARATFIDYPTAGLRGTFDSGRVALQANPLQERRSSFAGLHKWRRWSPIDALYFFGYALTHYHALPFSLPHARALAFVQTGRAADAFALTVQFPADVHTHCPVQTIYFDDSGLIVRHDYVAEIVGGWARGAHFWREYVTVDGLPVATHRRVLARLGGLALPLVALDARLGVPELT